jgi:hypothetical protein
LRDKLLRLLTGMHSYPSLAYAGETTQDPSVATRVASHSSFITVGHFKALLTNVKYASKIRRSRNCDRKKDLWDEDRLVQMSSKPGDQQTL